MAERTSDVVSTAAVVERAEAAYETQRVRAIYEGTDGEATLALFAELKGLGLEGLAALHLFRMAKCTMRAATYPRGHYAPLAFGRKAWALEQLTTFLTVQPAPGLGWRFGWGHDAETTPRLPWIFLVDLPTGQVGFRAPVKGAGLMYEGPIDATAVDEAGERILTFVESVVAHNAGHEDRPPLSHDAARSTGSDASGRRPAQQSRARRRTGVRARRE